MPTIIGVRAYLDVILAFAQLVYLTDVATDDSEHRRHDSRGAQGGYSHKTLTYVYFRATRCVVCLCFVPSILAPVSITTV